MNITPNYQLKIYHSRMNNQPLQTNPSFGMKQYVAPTVATLTGAAASALAAAALAKPNLDKPEETEVKIPTREEFEQIIENDKASKNYKERWLEAYDKDAKNTIAFFNLKDKEGNKYRDTDYLRILGGQKFHKHPELAKLVVDTEDEHGLRIFSFNAAKVIVEITADYPKGLAKMLDMKDEYGNLRFKNNDDFAAAEVFEKFPDEAEKYAMAKDEMGNYRFSGVAISNIVRAKMLEQFIQKNPDIRDAAYIDCIDNINTIIDAKIDGKLKPEDIDNILNLKRNDGSYVFNNLPDFRTIYKYSDEPELFTEICNTKIPNRHKYVENYRITRLMRGFRFYPEETKHLLQMPSETPYDSRFPENDIINTELEAQKLFKAAPKTFMTLASLTKGDYRNEGFLFDIGDICKIMKKVGNKEKIEEISEFTKEDMKVIYNLARIQVRSEHNIWFYLNTDEICKLFDIYKEYPKETKEIITEYAQKDRFGRYELIIPDKMDIEIYQNNPQSFGNIYVKR